MRFVYPIVLVFIGAAVAVVFNFAPEAVVAFGGMCLFAGLIVGENA